jgi:PAS domain S-box-containing protein
MAASDVFRLLVEHAPDGIVVSRNGIVLYANAAAARLLGHADASDLVGKPMTFLDRRQAEVMMHRIQQMAATGERLVPREYPARRHDGTEMIAEIASTIIEYEGAPAVLAYARDVTERTRLRTQLAHADRLASLGIMAAGVAHEINNPLTIASLATDALERRATEAEIVEQLHTGLHRIAAIVSDLRFFGRDDDDLPMPVDLTAVLGAAARMVAHEIRPRGTLVVTYGELPAIHGVMRRIEQVFVNLLLNAARALGDRTDGHITLSARVTDQHVVVSVTDDGVGIPEEMLELIFEPFFTTRGASGGSGLGLSICRDIVVRGGGNLVAKSVVGKGTTMEVTLPRTATSAAPRVDPAPPRTETSAPAASARVLVVDDEPLLVRTLVRMLARVGESRGFTVVGETDSQRALALIVGEPAFDVVVCDVMMPGLTGIDLHERTAAQAPGREARFIFMTGGAYTARARDYLERTPNKRFSKPFDIDDLVEAIVSFTTRSDRKVK